MALFVFPLKSINGSNMYNNDDFRQYFANFISTGILANVPLAGSTAFQVTQTDSPSMNVIVGSGVAWIIGGQVMNTSPLSFKIPAPLTSQSRTDSIVVQWSNSSNNGDIVYKQNSTQVVQSNDVYELQLCKILVPANATNIPQSNITDMRADPTVCGFSSPYEAIKTGDLLAQFKSELEANGVLFSEWFETIKGHLSEDAAGHLQNQLDSLDSKVYTAYANSADGTDGFTTVYPNLNLLNFKSRLKLGVNLDWSTGVGLLPNPARAVFDYVSVVPGKTYTINSNWDKTERIAIFAYDSNDMKNATFIYDGSSAKWVSPSTIGRVITQKTTLSIPDGMNFIRVVFFAKDASATLTLQDILDAKTKVEQGSTATPYMPSATEVTTADYPQYKYVGRMAGLNVADKSDPKNYRWQSNTDVVRDQNGTALVKDLEVSGKLTRPNKKVLLSGAYWMQAGQVVTPSKALSDCENGWLLHFTEYTSGMDQNTKNGQNHYCFIPKESANLGGVGVAFPLAHSDGISTLKYLYVQGTKITGTGANETTNSKKFVLQHVLEY